MIKLDVSTCVRVLRREGDETHLLSDVGAVGGFQARVDVWYLCRVVHALELNVVREGPEPIAAQVEHFRIAYVAPFPL
jgi:hypothetical protein